MKGTDVTRSRRRGLLAVGFTLVGIGQLALAVATLLMLSPELTVRFRPGSEVALSGFGRDVASALLVLTFGGLGVANLFAARWTLRAEKRVGIQFVALLDAWLAGAAGAILAAATLVVLHGSTVVAWVARLLRSFRPQRTA